MLNLLLFLFSDGPKFRHKPQNVQADHGRMVTLTCDVDGNPQPDIVWLHESKDRVSHFYFIEKFN